MRNVLSVLFGLLLAGCTAETFSTPAAAHLEIVQGAAQHGTPGHALDSLIVVRLVDDQGEAAVGAEVHWDIVAGAGTVTTASSVTGADGLAAARWSLGLLPGPQTLVISNPSVPAVTIGAEPRILTLDQFSVGADLGCGLDADGRPWCWGSDFAKALGTTDYSKDGPLEIGGDSLRFTHLAVGDSHACGITVGGEVWCWGMYNAGQLGDGRTGNWGDGSAAPVHVTGVPPIAQIFAHGWGSCGLTASGALWCWGRVPALPTVAFPQAAFTGIQFAQVSLSDDFACGISLAGQVLCWGINWSGQLGSGTIGGSTDTPTAIDTALTGRQISTASQGACAISTDDALWCWGALGWARGHEWSDTLRGVPTRVEAARVRAISLGGNCAAIWFGGASPWLPCSGWTRDIEDLPTISDAQFNWGDMCLRVGTGAIYCKTYSDVAGTPYFDFSGTGVSAP